MHKEVIFMLKIGSVAIQPNAYFLLRNRVYYDDFCEVREIIKIRDPFFPGFVSFPCPTPAPSALLVCSPLHSATMWALRGMKPPLLLKMDIINSNKIVEIES